MATHSSILAWRSPWTEEPSSLQSTGSQRVEQDLATTTNHHYILVASLVAQMVKHLPAMQETWVRFLGQEEALEKEQQPTPVFLPEESHGQRSLTGYSPWGHKSQT